MNIFSFTYFLCGFALYIWYLFDNWTAITRDADRIAVQPLFMVFVCLTWPFILKEALS